MGHQQREGFLKKTAWGLTCKTISLRKDSDGVEIHLRALLSFLYHTEPLEVPWETKYFQVHRARLYRGGSHRHLCLSHHGELLKTTTPHCLVTFKHFSRNAECIPQLTQVWLLQLWVVNRRDFWGRADRGTESCGVNQSHAGQVLAHTFSYAPHSDPNILFYTSGSRCFEKWNDLLQVISSN